MNSQRNTAKIIGNKTDLVLLLLSFYTRNFTPVGSNSNGNDVVICILNISYMLCSISLVNWTTCKQIAEIEKKVDVMLLKGNDNNNDHDPQSLNGIPLQNEKGGNGNDSVCSDRRGRRIEQ